MNPFLMIGPPARRVPTMTDLTGLLLPSTGGGDDSSYPKEMR